MRDEDTCKEILQSVSEEYKHCIETLLLVSEGGDIDEDALVSQ